MSVDKAAKGLIHRGEISDGILNKVEMAFRAYDPCHACATHSLPGSTSLLVTVRAPSGEPVATLRRAPDGSVVRG
jgi:F420-non-reducing hydrogenase large subunit